MNRFNFNETSISGLFLIESKPILDERGYFERLFCVEDLEKCGWDRPVLQMNISYSERVGTVRGMHFQVPPYREKKMVRCLKGEVFDVAVDLRPESPTFLKWVGVRLSEKNNRALVIPEGFAHGFQVLSQGAQLFYAHSEMYVPEAQKGVNPLDPAIGIDWPLENIIMSEKDRLTPLIHENQKGKK